MNILLVNDDGIMAEGIHQLAGFLKKGFPEARLYVCAPDQQRSAAGHGITVRKPLYLQTFAFAQAQQAYTCSGTPADCVKAGLQVFKREGLHMDLVCSGINMGSNLGNDILYSGTVSAALEGIVCGVPSVAFSVCSHEPKHYEAFEPLIPSVCRCALAQGSTRWMFNVNVPDLPAKEICGMRFTKMGLREYDENFAFAQQEDGRYRYEYLGKERWMTGLPEDNDVRAFQENCISITPLQRDLTEHEIAAKAEEFNISWK